MFYCTYSAQICQCGIISCTHTKGAAASNAVQQPLFIILFSVLRVIQMLAPFACQSGAQLQQCKAQDAGKNTGKNSTDPVSIGKTADQRNRHRSHQRPHGIGRGRIRKVAIPQTIAQTRDNRIDTADHEYDPLSGNLVRSPEHPSARSTPPEGCPTAARSHGFQFCAWSAPASRPTDFSCYTVKIS